MKKFLPLIPAFLLCFAGGVGLGWHKRKPEPGIVWQSYFYQEPEDGSLDKWKTELKKRDENAENAKTARDAIAKNKKKAETLEQLVDNYTSQKDNQIKLDSWERKVKEIMPKLSGYVAEYDQHKTLKEEITNPKTSFDERISKRPKTQQLEEKLKERPVTDGELQGLMSEYAQIMAPKSK